MIQRQTPSNPYGYMKISSVNISPTSISLSFHPIQGDELTCCNWPQFERCFYSVSYWVHAAAYIMECCEYL